MMLLTLLLGCAVATASPDFYWTRHSQASLPDEANGVAYDSTGNVYVTGSSFGEISFGTTNLLATGSGTREFFLVKYDASGNVIWVQRGTGNWGEEAKAVAVDSSGNVFITGNMSGTLTLGTSNLTSSGATDIFVAKFDSSGNLLWVQRAGGGGSDYDDGNGIATDAQGNVYVAGSFEETATFDGTQITSTGEGASFLAKYSGAGALLWVRSASGTSWCSASGVATDRDGNAFVTGEFEGTAAFGSTNLVSAGGLDVFVAKWDASGNSIWAKSGGSTNDDYGYGIAVDTAGNVAVTGVTAGPTVFGTTNFSTGGAFVAKYSNSGSLLWINQAGNSSATIGNGVACDNSGAVFVTGYFSGTNSFGSTNLVSAGGWDVFVARYDNAGNLAWAQSAGGSGLDSGYGVATDGNGNAIIAGRFQGAASFGNLNVSSVGGYDLFVAKYGPGGGLTWLRHAGGGAADEAYAVAANGTNVFVAGTYHYQINMGADSLPSAGYYDALLAKYDLAGNVIWAKSVGGPGNDSAHAVAVDASGNSYLAGQFDYTAAFGTNTLTSRGSFDGFLARFDPAGSVVWAVQMGGSLADQALALATDSAGNVIVAGGFQGTAAFGGINLTSQGSKDAFVAKYDSNGNCLWAYQSGGANNDSANGVGTDAAGNVYVTGTFYSNASFGTTNLASAGGADMFIAKYDSNGNFLWVRQGGGAGDDYGEAIATDTVGNSYVTGEFSGNATFGSSNLVSQSSQDLYLAKYDSNGSLIWIQQFGENAGSGYLSRGVCVDSSGNATVAGYFTGTATFGNTNIVAVPPTVDAFVAGFNAAGGFQYVRQAAGTDQVLAEAVATDGNGSLYVTGAFDQTATFGGLTLTSSGFSDIFLSKLTAPVAPVITTQPVGGTNIVENSFGFSVTAIGNEPLAYQWQHNGSAILNATNSSLSLANLQAADAGCYAVMVTNGYGATLSSNAWLVIDTNLPLIAAPQCLWAESFGGTSYDSVVGPKLDSQGNTFISGYFLAPANFGGITLTNVGPADMFLAKYDPAGHLLWVRQCTPGINGGIALAVDRFGNCFVEAMFSGTFSLGGTILTSSGQYAVLVAKYSSAGVLQWAVQTGGSGSAGPAGIIADNNGDFCFSGNFHNTITVGNSNLTVNPNYSSSFIAKYHADGSFAWVQQAVGIGNGSAVTESLAGDGAGDLYWSLTLQFGTVTIGGTNFTAVNMGSIVLAKFDPSGQFLWARQFDSAPGGWIPYAYLATDLAGDVFCAGVFSGTNYIGGIPITAANKSSPGATYLAKYDSAGNLLWVRQSGPTNSASLSVVTTDSAGNVYLSGYFTGTAVFGQTNLAAAGTDIFIAKYDGNGYLRWASMLGGTNSNYYTGIAVDANQCIDLAGVYYGQTVIGGVVLTNRGASDIFLAQLVPPAPAVLAISGAAGGYALSWPLGALGFVLQNANSLLPGTTWTAVQTSPTVTGTTNSVWVTNSPGQQFFRLMKSP